MNQPIFYCEYMVMHWRLVIQPSMFLMANISKHTTSLTVFIHRTRIISTVNTTEKLFVNTFFTILWKSCILQCLIWKTHTHKTLGKYVHFTIAIITTIRLRHLARYGSKRPYPRCPLMFGALRASISARSTAQRPLGFLNPAPLPCSGDLSRSFQLGQIETAAEFD